MTAPFVLEQCASTAQYEHLHYRFYPCGYLPQDLNTLIYVSYKPSHKIKWDVPVRLYAGGFEWSLFDCPDRYLLFTRANLTLGGDRPMNRIAADIKWNTAVALCPILSAGDDLPYDRFMLNPDGFTATTLPRARADNIYNSGKVIISDSGGFQLGTGKVNFIHPGELAETYNANADEGITLDIPPRGSRADPSMIKHTAQVQRLNTRYMLRTLKPGFRLANTIHGGYLSHVDQYRSIVEADDHPFDICCIAGSLAFNMIEAVHRILYIINNGQAYDQYHILGIGSPQMLAVLARIAALYAATGRNILITSDASTPVNMMISNEVMTQPNFDAPFARWSLRGQRHRDLRNPFKKLPLADPVSQIIGGYTDTKLIYSNAFVRPYLTYINQLETYRYGAMMYGYATQLDAREYKALVMDQLRGASNAHLLSQTLDYLDYAFTFGLDRAFKQFQYYMPILTGKVGLQKFHSLLDEGERDDRDTDETTLDARTARVKASIRGYYEFHKTGKAPPIVRFLAGKERF